MLKCLRLGCLLVTACGLAQVAVAAAPPKPVCTNSIVGRLWPDEANDNPQFAAALEPYGFPEVCTHTESGYEWRARTVSLSKLRKDALPKQRSAGKTKASQAEPAKSANQ